jgi:hypothetical protein
MLDSSRHGQEVVSWIQSLPCRVNLPPALRDNFEKTGTAATVVNEVRSGIRVHCRCGNNRAALQARQNLPAFPRKTEWHSVYVTNLSKKGCGFLHSQIFYPGEQFTLILLTGIQRTIEVAWCRRIDKNCFEVGSRFADGAPASPTED